MLRHFLIVPVLLSAAAAPLSGQTGTWPAYGGDPGGQRYSTAVQINRQNVTRLRPAWTFNTGVTKPGMSSAGRTGSFEATPILFKGSLYFTSPFDQVFALDPSTGAKLWFFDPLIDDSGRNLGIVTSRGVAAWTSSPVSALAAGCSNRIFVGTLDGRLLALDAANGQLCRDFGTDGVVDLNQNVEYRKGDDYSVTSPPTVIGDVVVVGAGIEDNLRVDVELGDVRGFDVHTGKLIWTWEPIPWAKHQVLRTGAGNTWSIIAADVQRGIVYLPTSSASPDYYGGLRPGDDRDADSIVALDGATGRKLWAFQVVHHNIWDYDIAAEPLLFTFRGQTPAVAVTTKMGLVFVFNRITGEPLYPIHERAVPQTDVPGEITSPTQPFPDLPPLSPLTLDVSRPLGMTAEDDSQCRALLGRVRYDGIYTPPSLRGSLLFPSNIGGVNWGSAALDPVTGILYANTNRAPFLVQLQKHPLIPPDKQKLAVSLAAGIILLLSVLLCARFGGRAGMISSVISVMLMCVAGYHFRDPLAEHLRHNRFVAVGGVLASHFGKETGANHGTPYTLLRQPFLSSGYPCGPTPWGTVSALNLNAGSSAWETPLGTSAPGKQTGTRNVGGPIVTAGGLVFTAASQEPYLRAFDSASGVELWKGDLPVPAQATPMTYTDHGKQYVVVSAGGSFAFGTAQGDSLVAFALR